MLLCIRHFLTIVLGTLTSSAVVADQDQKIDVIPLPARIENIGSAFWLRDTTILVDFREPDARQVAGFLEEGLRAATGRRFDVYDFGGYKSGHGTIHLTTGDVENALGDEGYDLSVGLYSVRLRAPTARGLFLGVQTLLQLLEFDNQDPQSARFRCVHITDRPRFPHRGMLLDCGRHFMSKDFVKRYIDLLAYHKMNVLHWHLTEDQGWRIEIKKYPRLTEVGAWRRITRDSEPPNSFGGEAEQPGTAPPQYGGFYTQDDIREVVAYAKSRYVTVIPEIEMPGHSRAALAAYPEISCTGGPFEVGTEWGVYEDVYCAGNEKTFEFLQDVLTEVMELFPSEYIHIGGDECPKTRWKACAKCQARIKAESLKDEHELQSYFVQRIEKFLNSKGRRLIGWDEILEGGLAPNATVQSWRGMDGAVAAATSGHDVIASPTSHCYLDYPQEPNPAAPSWMGFIDLAKIYSFEPIPEQLTAEQAKHILGVEGNIWSERAPEARVDHQVFPRLCALAEVGWSPKESRNWEDFERRMKTHYRRLDALGVKYCVPRPLPTNAETYFTEAMEVTFRPPPENALICYTLDGSDPIRSSPVYSEPLQLSDTTVVKARTFLRHTEHASDLTELRFVRLRPVPREDPGWRMRLAELNRRIATGNAELLFIGDSITQGWEGEGREVWQRYYASRKAVNLGISGDRTQHVLWRLAHGNMDGISPKVVVLMIGTNNSNGQENTPEQIANGIGGIVNTIRTKLPQTRVLLLAIFPRGEKPDAQRAKCAKASELASRLADGKMVHYLDIGDELMNADGSISPEVMPDFLHLSPRGYAIWAEAMEPTLSRLLGEKPAE